MVGHKSMIETAVDLLKRKRSPQKFDSIFKEVSETLGFSDKDMEKNISRFYNDLSLSALFIYTGSNEWDLKERQPIELWDKDASYFIDPEEIKEKKSIRQKEKLLAAKKEEERIERIRRKEEVKEEEVTIEEVLEEIEKVEDKKQEDVKEASKPESNEKQDTDRTDDFNLMDEEDYNEYMDDYEELYEEK
ncbi:DNA-directed RNA polymerase subunit delta [Mycoplasmatota bacterium]|nr:DNA-directed RNA polymerase subunit delta [Mycoplasmatota bacterium]